MATAQMETAAQRYRRTREQKEKGQALHDVECGECGFVWKARRAPVDFWVASGILPMSLVEKSVEASKRAGGAMRPEDLVKTMATKEVVDSIVFSNKVVRYTAVEPRIVETPEGPNDVAYEDVMICCYNRLRDWQMHGGDEAARLHTFRPQPAGDAVDVAADAGNGDTGVEAARG